MLRYGMVGGGRGGFIGAVHRQAAALDGMATLVAGALSSDPERAVESGRDLGLPDDRNYESWRAMLAGELARPEGDRIDFVSIVTPNDTHFEIARAFADAGFHVVLDKPMTLTSAEGDELARLGDERGIVFCVTYTYVGYPMIREARRVVHSGELGEVRKVYVDFRQGWLSTALENEGNKQAGWRTDPARAGAGALGDIGTHVEMLAGWITGLEIESLCAEVSTFVEGRAGDDDVSVLLRFGGGARGVLNASQVCAGEECAVTVRVFGTEGGVFWSHEDPQRLTIMPRTGATRIITRAGVVASDDSNLATRIPSGHPEGFIEAMGNLYRGAMQAMIAKREGKNLIGLAADYPNVHDGARGVRFVERVLESGRADGAWVRV